MMEDYEWRSMDSAPKDGTAVQLMIRHENYKYDRSEYKDR
jgi:hypothetical protein